MRKFLSLLIAFSLSIPFYGQNKKVVDSLLQLTESNISDKERCRRILTCFSESWRYVNSHLAGICRRKILLNAFGETDTPASAAGDCCDVCLQSKPVEDYKEELKILIDALSQVGCKGELKIAEWVRGSSISWTNAYNKNCLSYGNSRGKDLAFWRTFIKQCHVMSFVQLELRSMIKSSGHYAVNGVYYPTQEGLQAINGSDPFLLPKINFTEEITSSSPVLSHNSAKRKRLGKGTNILTTVRKLLLEPENWFKIENKSSYHFPGVLPKASYQQLFYIENVYDLQQCSEDTHFIWKDIQLSKGQLNRDRLIKIEVRNASEELYYRSAPCLGVKYCPAEGCQHTVPIRDKRNCPKHNTPLEKSGECPVEFVYLHPKNSEDGRRWFGGIVRWQKSPLTNFHNHRIHSATKISQCVREKISSAVLANPALTPSDVCCGKGLGFIPSAVDCASCHIGKVSQEVRKTKQKNGLLDYNWSPMEFERVADEMDKEDSELGGNESTLFKKCGRPYLISSGIEYGIKFIFTMSPYMSKIAIEADFLQCDITYDDCREYPYLFNAVAFDNTSMEWVVVARVRLDTQSSAGYALCFRKLFEMCQNGNEKFQLGITLKGVVTDWSDAEICGLKTALRNEMAEKLLKGCKVHWQRSCQRVAEKVISSKERGREKKVFLQIAYKIQVLDSSVSVIACFESLCGVRPVTQLLQIVPDVCSNDDAKFVDKNCDWSCAKHWAQWWTRSEHLKMLSRSFSKMEGSIWEMCPSSTNAVERRNRDCKNDTPQCLK